MKLKHYAVLLSIFTVIEIAVLALSSGGVPLEKISISKMGSLEGNYLFYLVATSVLLIMFSFFLHQLYKAMGQHPRLEIYLIPFLGIIALLFKTSSSPSTGNRLHTILFVIISVLILMIVYDLNKAYSKSQKTDRKVILTSKIAFYGTIGVFIVIGLNAITEIVYIVAILSWMHFIGSAAGPV